MSKTIAVTLSSGDPDVTLKGTIDAAGYAGSYNGHAYEAAVFGPAGTGFTLHVDGAVISNGTAAQDAGIVLGSPGLVHNDGGIRGASGIDIFDQPGGKRKIASVTNAGEIEATRGNGVFIQGAGIVRNQGIVTASKTGISLAGGGNVYNYGSIIGAAGVDVAGGTANYVYNSGYITAKSRTGISMALSGAVINAGQVTGAKGVVLAGGGQLYNFGEINGAVAGAVLAAGEVINYTGGTITGRSAGVSVSGAGYVYNAGVISASGPASAGILFADGGSLNNGAGATITGVYGITGAGAAVEIFNAGDISASSSIAVITLSDGGTLTNTGTLSGSYRYGIHDIRISGAAGTIINIGQILDAGIDLTNGGLVFNIGTIGYYDGVTFGAAGTIENTGTILSNVTMASSGAVINTGQMADAIVNGAGTVTNSGGMYIAYAKTGVITNTGFMSAAGFSGAGEVINEGGIGGEGNANGVLLGAGGTLVNDGEIVEFHGLDFGSNRPAITAQDGAVVINNGVVYALFGIQVLGGGTIIQSGTVRTGYDTSISFSSGFANRLIVTPGAVFGGDIGRYSSGNVIGGGGALELAAGTAAGSVTLGTMFADFDDMTIDSGAVWNIAGATSIGSFAVVNNGTILLAGDSELALGGTISGGGEIDLAPGGATLGAVAAGQTVAFGGSGEALKLGDPGGVAGTLENFAAGDTIVLAGVDIDLVKSVKLNKKGVLTVKEALGGYTFTFANAASFAGETFAAVADGSGIAITLQPAAQMEFLATAARPGATAHLALPSYTGSSAPASSTAISETSVVSGWVPKDFIMTALPALTAHVTFNTNAKPRYS